MTVLPVLGVDARGRDLVLARADAHGAIRSWTVPAAASGSAGSVVYGRAAARVLVEHPERGAANLLALVGDPVPCRVGDSAATASELVGRVVAAEAGGPVGSVRVVAPEAWGDARRASLASGLRAAGLPVPEWIAPAVADAPAGIGSPTLTLLIGPESTQARVWTPGEEPRLAATATVAFGTDTISDATYAVAAARLQASGRPLSAEHARALAAVSAGAAEGLPAAQRLDVNLPGYEPIRIARHELEAVVAPRATVAFAALPAALAALGVGEVPQNVWLSGPGSRIAAVADGIGRALRRPVQVREGTAAARVLGTGFAGAPASTPVSPAEVVPAAGRAAPARVAPRRPRRRRGVWIASALGLAAVAAAGVLVVPQVLSALNRPTAVPARTTARPASTPAATPSVPTPSAASPIASVTPTTPTASASSAKPSPSKSTTKPRATTKAPSPSAPATSATASAPAPSVVPPPTTQPPTTAGP